MNQDEPRDFRDDLIHQLREGRVVAIVGAGVSMGATHCAPCASWTGLLHNGVNRCVQVAIALPKGWAERVYAEIDSGDLDDLLSAAARNDPALAWQAGSNRQKLLAGSAFLYFR